MCREHLLSDSTLRLTGHLYLTLDTDGQSGVQSIGQSDGRSIEFAVDEQCQKYGENPASFLSQTFEVGGWKTSTGTRMNDDKQTSCLINAGLVEDFNLIDNEDDDTGEHFMVKETSVDYDTTKDLASDFNADLLPLETDEALNSDSLNVCASLGSSQGFEAINKTNTEPNTSLPERNDEPAPQTHEGQSDQGEVIVLSFYFMFFVFRSM